MKTVLKIECVEPILGFVRGERYSFSAVKHPNGIHTQVIGKGGKSYTLCFDDIEPGTMNQSGNFKIVRESFYGFDLDGCTTRANVERAAVMAASGLDNLTLGKKVHEALQGFCGNLPDGSFVAIGVESFIRDSHAKRFGCIYPQIIGRELRVKPAPTEETAKTSDDVLEVLRGLLRVPEGENILTHAKTVRALADGLIALSGQGSTIR